MEYICFDCPRGCGAVRGDDMPGGVCASPSLPRISRAAPHFGEEPCITGTRGSGAVFFTGCNLRCVFCQNREISRGALSGTAADEYRLRDIMLALQDKGVHNINLVTATHYVRVVRRALELAQLEIPVVWNSSGYDSVESLKTLEGLVQIYMPDYKYASPAPAKRYSAAADYPQVAADAIKEMYRQRGAYVMGEDGLLRSGVLIRHLILPGQIENTMDVIDFVSDTFTQNSVLFSLMSQYTPMPGLERFPELTGRVSAEDNRHMYRYMINCGIENGYWQDTESATADMIPDFDGTGV